METYIKTVLESLKEDNLNIPALREFLERELRECWKEAYRKGHVDGAAIRKEIDYMKIVNEKAMLNQFKKDNL